MRDELVTVDALAREVRVHPRTMRRRFDLLRADGARVVEIPTRGRPALAVLRSEWDAWCRGELRRAA